MAENPRRGSPPWRTPCPEHEVGHRADACQRVDVCIPVVWEAGQRDASGATVGSSGSWRHYLSQLPVHARSPLTVSDPHRQRRAGGRATRRSCPARSRAAGRDIAGCIASDRVGAVAVSDRTQRCRPTRIEAPEHLDYAVRTGDGIDRMAALAQRRVCRSN